MPLAEEGRTITVDGKTKRIAGTLWTEDEIQKRITELSEQIIKQYRPRLAHGKKLILVGILNGAVPLLESLRQKLVCKLGYDKVHYDFMSVSSYEDDAPGELRIISDLKHPVNKNHVLIVEDIIDSGHTFEFLRAALLSKSPASISCCALIDKSGRREIDNIDIGFIGFHLEQDRFLAGFGLDWKGEGRNYPSIVWLEDEISEEKQSVT